MGGFGDEWTGKGASVLDGNDEKVPDGLRYHVLDVWVDGLLECDEFVNKGLLEPVQRVTKEGKTKTLRTRAKGVLEDERLFQTRENDEDDFEGFDE